jgi:hypothetical protein
MHVFFFQIFGMLLDVNFLFLKCNFNFTQSSESTISERIPQYFVFTEIEVLSLAVCIIMDVIEYAATVLTFPLIGDAFDVIGIVFCLLVFRWFGLVSLVELLPGADVLPVFIITWLIWYFSKKFSSSTHSSVYYKKGV